VPPFASAVGHSAASTGCRYRWKVVTRAERKSFRHTGGDHTESSAGARRCPLCAKGKLLESRSVVDALPVGQEKREGKKKDGFWHA